MHRPEDPARTLTLTVEPFSPGLASEIAGAEEISFGVWLDGPHGVKVWMEPPRMQRGLSPEAIGLLTVVLSVPAGVASQLVGKWVSETLTRGKRSPRRIMIRTQTVEFDKGEIQRVVEQELEVIEEERLNSKER